MKDYFARDSFKEVNKSARESLQNSIYKMHSQKLRVSLYLL